MKAEIKYLHSPDILDLKNYIPEMEDNFSFLLQIMVGIKGKPGEESFDIIICTPKWLSENFKNDDMVVGLHYMIVFEYSYQNLYQKLSELMCIEGNNWEEIAHKLSYIGKWEFENYKP